MFMNQNNQTVPEGDGAERENSLTLQYMYI